jgi:formamidopyrimidine-DNA glycosylase
VPELPDITVYVECLGRRVIDRRLERIRIANPFVLRTVTPPIADAEGRRVSAVRRIGKRIVVGLEDGLFLVIHLMVAGRLRWRDAGAKAPGRIGLAAFDFSSGTLILTEAGSKRRASLHLISGEAALARLDPGGLDVFESSPADFGRAFTRQNHTLKRALTDPRIVSGVGNAYSDEILHAARLSPLRLTASLSSDEVTKLHRAVRETLAGWTARLRREVGDGFPEKVTAFREGMAVHGRYGKPCPACGALVQRIVYAENETNYCARCQTGGRRLADRALSRLLGKDWPRTLDDE